MALVYCSLQPIDGIGVNQSTNQSIQLINSSINQSSAERGHFSSRGVVEGHACSMTMRLLLAAGSAALLAVSAGRPLELPRLCRVCRQPFTAATVDSCRFHSGRWMGAENSKHHGSRSGGRDTGLSLFWDCCEGAGPDAPGCCTGRHRSYEDAEDSVLINRKSGT